MIRLVVLPVAVGVVHVLDGVLADLDRYLVNRLHSELRARVRPSTRFARSGRPGPR